MKIPLNAFEQHIDETILKRGLSYFKKGLVEEPEEISPGEYESIVEGTETYTVRLTIKNEILTDYSCTCPYDFGPICKHIAAVLFYMQQDALDIHLKSGDGNSRGDSSRAFGSRPVPAGTAPEKPPRPKKMTVTDQVKAILNKMPEAEMRACIIEMSSKDRIFRQKFINRYLHLIIPESKELYTTQVKAILKANSNRHGDFGYYESDRAGKEIYDLLMNAQYAMDQQQVRKTALIACAVIDEMKEVFDYADDSNGSLSDCVETAWEILYMLSEQEIPDSLREELFEFCVYSIGHQAYKGWDWQLSFYDLAVELANDEPKKRTMNALLSSFKSSKSHDSYDFRSLQEIKLKLIQKTEGAAKAEEFVEQNLANPDFLKRAIELAIQKHDLNKAVALAEEGIKQNQKGYPGLADQFKDILLHIYCKIEDRANSIKVAREMLISSNHGSEQYYSILKKQVPVAEWTDFVNAILKEIATRARWTDFHLMAAIFIWEERFENLYKLVAGKPSLEILDTYEKHLVKKYSTEIAELYHNAIMKYLEQNAGRNHYQTACRYLNKMRKMGAGTLVDATVEELRRLYPMRKALIEELEKV